VRNLTASQVEARIPAVQVRLLCGVTHGMLKQLGRELAEAKARIRSGDESLARLSYRAEGAFRNWPWSECGTTVRGCTAEDIDPENEDYFPLAVVSRSINNILKSSYHQVDEQIVETEKFRSTVAELRSELDQAIVECDEALDKAAQQERHSEDLRQECESLREFVRRMQRLSETSTSEDIAVQTLAGSEQVAPSAGRFAVEYRQCLDRLGRLERELEWHRFKGGLFDGLCQEIKLLPFGLGSAAVAEKCLDTLRAWVKLREGQLLEKCGAMDEASAVIGGREGDSEPMEFDYGVEVEGDADTSFNSFGSPVPASSVESSMG
jgi:hypothetical protein